MSIALGTLWDLTDDELEALSPSARTNLNAATKTLARYIKVDRVHDVVRRPAPDLGGRPLLDLVHARRFGELREYVESMFDLRRIAP
jgi:hypothetical protein